MMPRVGFACAYTPVPLIDGAGCEPYRVLPTTDAADQAGRIIHDNMCPHVKRILDRAMDEDLPDLLGMVLVNSCDAMRRLSDGWRQIRPKDRVFLLDLPPSTDERSIRWLATELERLRRQIAAWVGHDVTDDDVAASMARHDELAGGLAELHHRARAGTMGSPALQLAYNELSSSSLATGLAKVQRLVAEPPREPETASVPVHLFGNVLCDPAVFELIEECGARVVSDDLCTGSRLFQPLRGGVSSGSPLEKLARGLLSRPACARTMRPDSPGQLGKDIVRDAKSSGARAVIGHIVKFCDPYLGRMPSVRQACAAASLPLLVLEGDCTLRSVGQQTTRIEAFVEMLG